VAASRQSRRPPDPFEGRRAHPADGSVQNAFARRAKSDWSPPITVTALEQPATLVIDALEAIDGTPIVDLKIVMPESTEA